MRENTCISSPNISLQNLPLLEYRALIATEDPGVANAWDSSGEQAAFGGEPSRGA